MNKSLNIDDIGIDNFAEAMRKKMALSRSKGRSGWDDPALCSGEQLVSALIEHLSKGNDGTFEDIANFAMMLHQRKESPRLLVWAINSIKASVASELALVLIEASDNAGANGYLEEAQTMADAAELISSHSKKVMQIKEDEASV